jgi:hypothetical protein
MVFWYAQEEAGIIRGWWPPLSVPRHAVKWDSEAQTTLLSNLVVTFNLKCQFFLILCFFQKVLFQNSVLRTFDILVWVRIQIRGSTNGFGSGSGSCYFRQWPSRWQLNLSFDQHPCLSVPWSWDSEGLGNTVGHSCSDRCRGGWVLLGFPGTPSYPSSPLTLSM